MWSLWFVPLVMLLFLAGAVLGLVWFVSSHKDRRPTIATVAAVPFVFAATPIIGLTLLGIVGASLQKSDTQLFTEMFGYRPTLTEDRMLFDDFGSGGDREIYMRAEPTDSERRKIMSIPGRIEPQMKLDQFVAHASQHGLMWWIAANPLDDGYCKSAQIVDADGFRGWNEFRIAECLDAGKAFPASTNVGKIYVIASHRPE